MSSSALPAETPKANGPTLGPALSRALEDLEKRIRLGQRQSCESILAAYPEVATNKDALLELVYTEHVVRQELGDEAPIEEWLDRFPQWRDDLRDLFRVHDFVSSGADQVRNAAFDSRAVDDWENASEKQGDLPRIGRFQLIEEIGWGGMGVVYRAQQLDLDRTVAVKTITGPDVLSPEVRRRFRAEAEAAARLQHPHIVQIYEVGDDEHQPYFSMEYISGGNLATHIRKHPLPAIPAARLIERVARAIDYAHSQGIIHRDLKPANILLAPSERPDAIVLHPGSLPGRGQAPGQGFEPKITDFGLAKRLDNTSQRTLPGAALGTPSYMAPEQARGDAANATAATDVYSLGAVLYDMLVGRPPFHAATIHETLEQVCKADPISIRNLQPDVPRDLETICMKCLQKDPARRYATAAELADDLERFLGGKLIHARPATPAERCFKWTRRHPALTALAITIALGVIGIGWQWYRAEMHRMAAERSAIEANRARTDEEAERERVERTLYAHDVSLANFEYLSNNASRATQLLEACPPQFRHWEWQYIQQKCQQQLWDFGGFTMPVRGVAVSPDGSLVAGASAIWGDDRQGEIRVFDTKSGELKWKLVGHPGPVMRVEFDVTGQRLLSVGTVFTSAGKPGKVIVWDLASGEPICTVEGVSSMVAKFSPDGKFFAVGSNTGVLSVHDSQTGKVLSRRNAHQGNVFDVAFWPDGRHIVSGGRDGDLHVWDTEKLESVTSVTGLADVRRVTCCGDGKKVAIGTFGGGVFVFEFENQRLRQTHMFYAGDRLAALKYTPDGQYLVVTALNKGACFIDPRTGWTFRELHGHNGVIIDISVSEDGRLLATSGMDGTVKVWRLTTPSSEQKHGWWGPFIADFDWFPGGRHAAMVMGLNTAAGPSFDDRTVKLWDSETGAITRVMKGHTGWLTSVAVDPQGRWVLSGSEDQSARLWDAANGALIYAWKDHPGAVVDVAFAMEGQFAVTATRGGTLRIYENASGDLTRQWKTGTTIACLASHPKQTLIATSGPSGEVLLWRESSDLPVSRLRRSVGPVSSLAFSFDGQILAATREDATIDLWDTRQFAVQDNAHPVATLRGHTGPVRSVSFSQDGIRLASSSDDRTLKLWDVKAAQEVLSISGVGVVGVFSKVAISPDAVRIAHIDQTQVETWSIRKAEDGVSKSVVSDEMRNWHLQQMRQAQGFEQWFGVAHHAGILADLEPQESSHHAQRGAALVRLGHYDDAIAEFQAALKLKYTTQEDEQLALVCLRQGDLTKRREACNRLFERDKATTNDWRANNLAWMFAIGPDLGPHADEIVALAERSAARIKRSEIINTLGAIYLRIGRVEQAIEKLKESIKLSGQRGRPHDWAFLAVACAAKGDQEEAQKWLAQVKSWLAEQEEKRANHQLVDPFDTWSHRLELEILVQEATDKLAAK
jgi:WD40 repeat protein/Flp pilus assembly protein TadD